MKNAVCDVLIVQTSALDEERVLGGEEAAEPDAAPRTAGGGAASAGPG